MDENGSFCLFILLNSMNKNSKQIAQNLANQVLDTLSNDINQGKLTVPDDPIQHQLPHLSKSVISKTQQRQEAKLHDIIRKRKNLEEELQRLKYDEVVVKQKIPHPMQESQEGRTRYFRSRITEDEKDKIKKVLKDASAFERSLQLKNQQLEKRIQQLKEEEKAEKYRINEERLQEKRRNANKNLQQIQLRKRQRSREINEANRQFQRVAKMKSLHDTIQEKWRLQKMAEEEENQRFLQKNREDRKFKISQIKEHARRYSDIVTSQKQRRSQNQQMLKQSLINQSRLAKHSYSTFFKTATKQQALQKQQQQQKLQQDQIRYKNKQQYAETVREKNMSTLKTNPKIQQPKTLSDIRTSRSLDNLALNKLGNGYMKQIHECIGETALMEISKPVIKQVEKKEEVQKHMDYLTKARMERKMKNPEDEPAQLKQLKSLMKKKDDTKEMRLYKARALVQKLDSKAEKNSKILMQAIIAKLTVIEQFSQLK